MKAIVILLVLSLTLTACGDNRQKAKSVWYFHGGVGTRLESEPGEYLYIRTEGKFTIVDKSGTEHYIPTEAISTVTKR